MSDKKKTVDLAPLADDYEIVGEAGETDFTRTYIGTRTHAAAKRRDDNAGVLITVVTTPKGDEGNALLHLASDTKTLAGASHRRLIPVIEGRWLGDDAFAVITQRITDPTLAQRLAAGETFTNPRIAALLREVNGLLEWAREQKIVHRTVTPDTIHLEPRTDRVRVSFAAAPIPRIQPSDPAALDAQTIARLASEMLAATDTEGTGESELGLRPALPTKLAEATKELIDAKTTSPEDVASYLALIGMADPLYAGETEAERIRAEVLEEQRVEREKLAAERAEFERKMAEERANLERRTAEERQKLEAERESLHRAIAEERASLERAVTAERATLKRAAEKERAAVTALRAELDREIARQRAELERAAATDRREIDALRARIQAEGRAEVEKKRQAQLAEIADEAIVLDQGKLATPLFAAPVLPTLPAVVFDNESPLLDERGIDFAPAKEEEQAPAPVAVEREVKEGGDASPSGTRRWMMPTAIAGVLAIAVASAVLVAGRYTAPRSAAKPVAKVTATPTPPPTPKPDSTSAAIASAPTPTVVDSAAGSVGRALDSAKTTTASAESKPKPKKVVRDSTSTQRARAVRDSSVGSASSSRRRTLTDSLWNFRDPVPVTTPARRDSSVKRDTAPKPDNPPKPPDTTSSTPP